MADDWAEAQRGFEQAAEWFVRVVPMAGGHLDEPGLGEWSIRDLVGHTSRAILTVESYLSTPAATIEVSSPREYFTKILASGGDPAAVARRGREAGAALGKDPAASVRAIVDRVLDSVRAARGDTLVTTPAGGMRLVDYLPTRTFELTVHTCDLANALDQPLEAPHLAAAQSLAIVGALAIDTGAAPVLLLATTGRRALPTGFSVV